MSDVVCPRCGWRYVGPTTLAGLRVVEEHAYSHRPDLLAARLAAVVEAAG